MRSAKVLSCALWSLSLSVCYVGAFGTVTCDKQCSYRRTSCPTGFELTGRTMTVTEFTMADVIAYPCPVTPP